MKDLGEEAKIAIIFWRTSACLDSCAPRLTIPNGSYVDGKMHMSAGERKIEEGGLFFHGVP